MTAVEIRFWEKVEIAEPGVCWLWLASLNNKGYGAFQGENKTWQAHRFSYQLHFGDIPEGLCVCHHCDNPQCVNPNHLFLGTYSDNNFDCVSKGRHTSGGGSGRPSILTKEQKEIMKELYATGNYTLRELADSYNVNYMTIQRAIKGE